MNVVKTDLILYKLKYYLKTFLNEQLLEIEYLL